MNIQFTHFLLCEFILEENGSHNENKSSISLLKIFLQLSYPTLDAQRSWERIPILIFAHEQASGVVRLLSISLCEVLRPLLRQALAGSACPAQGAAVAGSGQLSPGPGQMHLIAAGG